MITVALETATAAASVAVVIDDQPAVELVASTDRHHTEALLPALAELLASTGHGPQDIDVIVVDVGPGLFTGLRVGVATARSLASALGLGLLSISSLELLAASVLEAPTCTAVVEARRAEVFVQSSELGSPRPRAVGEPLVLSPAALADELRAGTRAPLVVGDGAQRYAAELEAAGATLESSLEIPSAGAAATMAAAGLLGTPLAPAAVVPHYLRDPDAVANFQVAQALRPRS